MVITYHGLDFFKLSWGDTVIAFNPVSKSSEHKSSSFGADMAIVSLNDEDFNGWETLARGDKKPFVINGPGEYEYKGIFVQGFPSSSNYKKQKRINTFYNVTIEDMTVTFLGVPEISQLKEHLNVSDVEIDILFVPIGGNGVLEADEAAKLAVSLQPKIIIPMHYGFNNDKSSLQTFLKEIGGQNVKPVDKLVIKRKDLIGKEGEVVVLSQG